MVVDVGLGAEIFQRLDFLTASLAENDLVENSEFCFFVFIFISLRPSSSSSWRSAAAAAAIRGVGGGISSGGGSGSGGGGSSCCCGVAVSGMLFSYSTCRLGLRRIFLESFSWIKPWLVAWS